MQRQRSYQSGPLSSHFVIHIVHITIIFYPLRLKCRLILG